MSVHLISTRNAPRLCACDGDDYNNTQWRNELFLNFMLKSTTQILDEPCFSDYKSHAKAIHPRRKVAELYRDIRSD